MHTGTRSTLVNFFIAVNSSESRVAETHVAVDLVKTVTVQTRVGQTLVNVFIAQVPSPAGIARACK